MTEGVVVDGSPGTYGSGCTMDNVVEFASAYSFVMRCAVIDNDIPSMRALRRFHDEAKELSSPASQKRLEAATKETR
jgi:hypothetical protein